MEIAGDLTILVYPHDRRVVLTQTRDQRQARVVVTVEHVARVIDALRRLLSICRDCHEDQN